MSQKTNRKILTYNLGRKYFIYVSMRLRICVRLMVIMCFFFVCQFDGDTNVFLISGKFVGFLPSSFDISAGNLLHEVAI